jgi:hypothetical protein
MRLIILMFLYFVVVMLHTRDRVQNDDIRERLDVTSVEENLM